jgi:hypothetical protein
MLEEFLQLDFQVCWVLSFLLVVRFYLFLLMPFAILVAVVAVDFGIRLYPA